jgi:hypothetical protein
VKYRVSIERLLARRPGSAGSSSTHCVGRSGGGGWDRDRRLSEVCHDRRGARKQSARCIARPRKLLPDAIGSPIAAVSGKSGLELEEFPLQAIELLLGGHQIGNGNPFWGPSRDGLGASFNPFPIL